MMVEPKSGPPCPICGNPITTAGRYVNNPATSWLLCVCDDCYEEHGEEGCERKLKEKTLGEINR